MITGSAPLPATFLEADNDNPRTPSEIHTRSSGSVSEISAHNSQKDIPEQKSISP